MFLDYMLRITDMAKARDFEVMSDKFNAGKSFVFRSDLVTFILNND
jgi:hypothetical protein